MVSIVMKPVFNQEDIAEDIAEHGAFGGMNSRNEFKSAAKIYTISPERMDGGVCVGANIGYFQGIPRVH